jgi:hypothetical protein
MSLKKGPSPSEYFGLGTYAQEGSGPIPPVKTTLESLDDFYNIGNTIIESVMSLPIDRKGSLKNFNNTLTLMVLSDFMQRMFNHEDADYGDEIHFDEEDSYYDEDPLSLNHLSNDNVELAFQKRLKLIIEELIINIRKNGAAYIMYQVDSNSPLRWNFLLDRLVASGSITKVAAKLISKELEGCFIMLTLSELPGGVVLSEANKPVSLGVSNMSLVRGDGQNVTELTLETLDQETLSLILALSLKSECSKHFFHRLGEVRMHAFASSILLTWFSENLMRNEVLKLEIHDLLESIESLSYYQDNLVNEGSDDVQGLMAPRVGKKQIDNLRWKSDLAKATKILTGDKTNILGQVLKIKITDINAGSSSENVTKPFSIDFLPLEIVEYITHLQSFYEFGLAGDPEDVLILGFTVAEVNFEVFGGVEDKRVPDDNTSYFVFVRPVGCDTNILFRIKDKDNELICTDITFNAGHTPFS